MVGIIILGVMFMYLAVLASMFNPESMAGLEAMMKTLPKEMVSAMGFDNLGTTITTYLGNTYYNFIAVVFPMIYCIVVGNRLIAKHVDRGSMAYLLSTPNSRLNVVTTQALYLIVSVTALFSLVTTAGIIISQAMFPGQLEVGGFIMINVVALFMFYAIGGICFFFSCISDDTKYSVGFGAGVPIALFVIDMMANIGGKLDWLKYLTIITLLDPSRILEGTSFAIVGVIILAIIAFIMYWAGIVMFNRRNLPI